MSFLIFSFILLIDITAHGVTDGDKGFIQESTNPYKDFWGRFSTSLNGRIGLIIIILIVR